MKTLKHDVTTCVMDNFVSMSEDLRIVGFEILPIIQASTIVVRIIYIVPNI